MAVTIQEILQPQVILDLVSRIREGQGALGRWLGFQPNKFDPSTVSVSGSNTVTGPTRYPTYRIFDFTRVPAKAVSPASGPVTVSVNPVANTQVACLRFHQKVPLNYEFLSNLSPMVGPNSVVDQGGQNYIDQQSRFIAQQFNHAVEFMAAGMMRDSLYLVSRASSGQDKWELSFDAASTNEIGFQVNFQIPAGNKNQGDMLGSGNIIDTSWANNTADIIAHCIKITAAFQQLSGYQLTDIWTNSLTWLKVIENTSVRNTAGSANVPFAEYKEEAEKGMDGEPTGKFTGVLRGLPWLTWHINDDVVATKTDIDPSYSTAPAAATLKKVIPDNMAIFTTRVSPTWTKMYLGGEYIVENPGMLGTLRSGYYFWKEYTTQPSGIDLIGLLNALPLLYVPKAVAPLTVIF